MKSTLIATFGALIFAVPALAVSSHHGHSHGDDEYKIELAPASAGHILDADIYAREYCNLRSLGWQHEEAVDHAVQESLTRGLQVEVLHDCMKVDADVIVAFAASQYRCPDQFPNKI